MPPRSNNPRSGRVAIICSNNGSNCLGRSLLLADLLRPQWDASVVGVQTTARPWEPGASFDVPVRSFPIRSAAQLPNAVAWLRKEVQGARVIVCKPKPTSLGLALAAGVRPSQAVLDVDDWDLGFGDAPGSRGELYRRAPYYLKTLLHPGRFNSYLGVRAAFGLIPAFPHRIVSNGWLRRKVGGELLPHVRDSSMFDPAGVDREQRRAALALSARPWVGFIGTIRPHKGIEDLIAALSQLGGVNAPGLLLAGLSAEHVAEERALLAAAQERLGEDRVRFAYKFPFRELPSYLAAPDVICIPSRPGATSAGQIPAKLFDALMMGKPLVISDAHDTSDVDADAAVRFHAGDVSDLAAKLQDLCGSPAHQERLGARARAVALERFDYAAARSVLVPLLERLPPQRG
ncbi:MAG: glycosyltransferase [Myxococcales bacterium]|nr:MAG: glycosyltransferase [Myxococcales bacterium]